MTYSKLVWTGCAVVIALSAPGAAAQSADAVSRGAGVFAAQKCGICHSVADLGNKRGALDDVGARLSVADIRAWIVDAPGMTKKTKAERKPPMRAYANLADADLDALVAYLQSLKP